MADVETNGAVSGQAAEGALAYLTEMSPDLRGAAILDSAGAVLAATSEPNRWREDAAALLDVSDRAGEEPVRQVHVATEQGEVFALRHDGLAALVVSERFALSSLMFFDMRSVLRELAQKGGTAAGGDETGNAAAEAGQGPGPGDDGAGAESGEGADAA